MVFFNEIFFLPFLTTFTQVFYARLKNFLRGWLLVLGLVECATVCVKSEVILVVLSLFGCRTTKIATSND